MTPDTHQKSDALEFATSEGNIVNYVDKVDCINRGFLAIGEVIKQTGVTKATVHHYVSLKVLPPPVKTAHNMAYYHPNSISIIKVIRALKDRHVPLSVAKQLLDEHGIERVKEMIRKTLEELLLAESITGEEYITKSKESILSTSGLSESHISELERLGLIELTESGEYDSLSVDLIECLTTIRKAGLDESAGFLPRDLVLYKKALEPLVANEIEYFSTRLFSVHHKHEAIKVMEAALEQAEKICILVRRRILLNSFRSNLNK